MSRRLRNSGLLLLALVCLTLSAFASVTATVTVTGGETQRMDQSWDIGPLMVTVNVSGISYVETIYYGQYSSPASVASTIAGLFSRDHLQDGICASANGTTITFKALHSGAAFGMLTVSGPSSSFALNGSGFGSYNYTPPSSGGEVSVWTGNMVGGQDAGTFYDQGTVSVRVGGATASADWSEGSTPSSVASELASAINTAAGGFVNANASGATISVASLNGGPATDLSIAGSTADTQTSYFAGPSFSVATTNMSGGSASEGDLLYGFTIPDQGGYAVNGNLLTAVDSVMGQWNYSYDNLNRLTGAVSVTNSGQGVNNAFAGVTPTWNYDAFGNRTSEIWTSNNNSPASVPSTSSAAFTPATNQLSSSNSYTYDAAGDVTWDGLNYYLYDAEGRICAVKNYSSAMTGYIYDGSGIRVAKGSLAHFTCDFNSSDTYNSSTNQGFNGFVTTTSWVLGPGDEQVTEYSVASGASTWAHTNAFASGSLLATYYGTDTYFALNDWLGTKRAEVSAGGCFSYFTSMPFGNGLPPSPAGNCADATEQHFTGKERDAESGNDYFDARYYSSAMGRFMSPDWSAKEDPVPYAQLDDPQSLNLYAYVRNNPLGGVDADGHDWMDALQYASGVVQGVESSLTGGLVGSPRASDSAASLSGQLTGSLAVTHISATALADSGIAAGGGLIAAPESGGTSLAVEPVAGAVALVSLATAAGGAKNSAAVLAMSLSKPPTGKGSVPKEDRAKPRTATDKERVEMRKEQNGNCAHCDKPLGNEDGISHHDPVRHSDGGTEQKLVHSACHAELHGKC